MYPGSIPSYNTPIPGETLAAGGHTALHIAEESDLVALATKLGTGSSTPSAGSVLRANGTGTSIWGAVDLKHDVTGIMPVANGGTGNASLSFPSGVETVVGRAVSETLSNKTLTTPAIASFINALHDHTNSAGGGPLGASTVGSSQIVDNSIAFGDLLSTIFSGQVQTQAQTGGAGGTMWWVNLGGIKILWAVSASKASSNPGTAWDWSLPTFFSSVQASFATAFNMTSQANQFIAYASINTTSFSTYFCSPGGAGTTQAALLLIGT